MANLDNIMTVTDERDSRHSMEDIENLYFTDADILHSEMAAAMTCLDFNSLEDDEAIQLANCCQENIAGLSNGLNFIGKVLNTFAVKGVTHFSAESLCQAGHCLTAMGSLIPALSQLQQRAEFKAFSNHEN